MSLGTWTGKILLLKDFNRIYPKESAAKAVTKSKNSPRRHGVTEKSKRKGGVVAGRRVRVSSVQRQLEFSHCAHRGNGEHGIRTQVLPGFFGENRHELKRFWLTLSSEGTRCPEPYSVVSVASVTAVKKTTSHLSSNGIIVDVFHYSPFLLF
jgi:hypothetical protein